MKTDALLPLSDDDGKAVTICYINDRYPGTVIRETPARKWIRRDIEVHLSGTFQAQNARFAYFAGTSDISMFTKRKNGLYREVGSYGPYLHFGKREYYRAPEI